METHQNHEYEKSQKTFFDHSNKGFESQLENIRHRLGPEKLIAVLKQ